MAGKKWNVDEPATLLNRRGIKYKLKVGANGSVDLETKNAADHIDAMETIDRTGDMRKEVTIQVMTCNSAPTDARPPASPTAIPQTTAPAPRAVLAPAAPSAVMPMEKAVTQWVKDIQQSTRGKTLVS